MFPSLPFIANLARRAHDFIGAGPIRGREIRDRDRWNRGSALGHGNGRKGRLARAVARRRRLNQIAKASRRRNRAA